MVKLLPSRKLILNEKYNIILIITDKLTKYVYIILYFEIYIAKDLAYIFLRIMVTNYRVLNEVISNQDKFFTSKFWIALVALLGIKQKLSIAFYP